MAVAFMASVRVTYAPHITEELRGAGTEGLGGTRSFLEDLGMELRKRRSSLGRARLQLLRSEDLNSGGSSHSQGANRSEMKAKESLKESGPQAGSGLR